MANVTECSKKSTPRMSNPWPLRIKLTNDRMLWDSIKISSKEFEEFILGQMNESSRKSLESWIPVNILIYDVDNCETYDAKLFKKESFWFDPMPVLGEKPKKGESMKESSSYSLEKARKEFAYSIEPFRQIIRKRALSEVVALSGLHVLSESDALSVSPVFQLSSILSAVSLQSLRQDNIV
ncbi:hypothetical protein HKD37_03G008766 [Glycine soja]